jgi:hypothetical protein
MLLCDDMVWLVRKVRIVLMDQAVLASAVRAGLDETPQCS